MGQAQGNLTIASYMNAGGEQYDKEAAESSSLASDFSSDDENEGSLSSESGEDDSEGSESDD